MKKPITLLFIFMVLLCSITAQEINCKIIVNSDRIQGSNKQMFQSLQTAMTEMINNRKWTDARLGNMERIECTWQIVINEFTNNEDYKCELTLQAKRPIFNASIQSPLLNWRDKNFDFKYIENVPLEFSETSIDNELTAMMAYYVYLMLGLDADSFVRYGGTPFYQQAQNIASQGQSFGSAGWSPDDQSNRYGLINSLLDNTIKSFRDFYYEYHRLGLDPMSQNVEEGRAKITADLPMIKEVYQTRPLSVIPAFFIETKADELVNIYSKAPTEERNKIHELLMDVFPTYGKRLDAIKNPPVNR